MERESFPATSSIEITYSGGRWAVKAEARVLTPWRIGGGGPAGVRGVWGAGARAQRQGAADLYEDILAN